MKKDVQESKKKQQTNKKRFKLIKFQSCTCSISGIQVQSVTLRWQASKIRVAFIPSLSSKEEISLTTSHVQITNT